MSNVLDVHVLFCFQVDRLILYLGQRGVGGGGGWAYTCKWGTCYVGMAVYSLR